MKPGRKAPECSPGSPSSLGSRAQPRREQEQGTGRPEQLPTRQALLLAP